MIEVAILFLILGIIGISIPIVFAPSDLSKKEKVAMMMIFLVVYMMAEIGFIVFLS